MGGPTTHSLAVSNCIEYTADHELMAAWDIDVVTAATIPALTLPSGAGTRSAGANIAYGTHHEDIAMGGPCLGSPMAVCMVGPLTGVSIARYEARRQPL